MDQNRLVAIIVIAVVALFSITLGYTFLVDHWEDIKTLALVTIVLGGTFSLALGGLRIRSGR